MNLTPEAAAEEYALDDFTERVNGPFKYLKKTWKVGKYEGHLAGQQRIIDMIPRILPLVIAYDYSPEEVIQMILKGEI